MANFVTKVNAAKTRVSEPRNSGRAPTANPEPATFESATLPVINGLARGAAAAAGILGAASIFFLSPAGRVPPSVRDQVASNTHTPLFGFRSVHTQENAAPTDGWRWAVEPQEIPSNSVEKIFVRLEFLPGDARPESIQQVPDKKWEVNDGQLLVPIQREKDGVYQLIACDSKGKRTAINFSTRDPNSLGFWLPANSGSNWIGFQVARPDELAKISTAAYLRAISSGLHFLPAGKVDEPFAFTLSTVDGKTVSKEDFHGKVVVMLEWATWCAPCHVTMKKLFAVLEKYNKDVQLILVSHDGPERRGMALEKMQSFPDGTINVGLFSYGGKDVQELWSLARKGVGSYPIPNVIIVGPDGILMMDAVSPQVESVENIILKAIKNKLDL